MTALTTAMTTRNRVLTTVKALDQALRQAEFDGTAATRRLSFAPPGDACPLPHHRPG
jgi:hypothetical protein